MIYIGKNEKNYNMVEENLVYIDSSVFFGRGVFETIHVLKEGVFLKEHLKRLKEGCEALEIPFNINEEDLKEFIKNEKINNKALKITVTEKNIIYSTRNITYSPDDYNRGFSLKLSDVRRNSTSKLTYLKSTCYIENIMEKERAKDEGFDEVIFLNERGELTEGATSNLYFIKDNKIHTPKVSCGLLNGIIRKWIEKNFLVEEGSYTIDDLRNSEGIFISNSLLGIMKVRQFEDEFFGEKDLIEEIKKKYDNSIRSFLEGGQND
ncbi:aminotransferase class IV [Clostridium sp. LIBA-8841]|uniref:aminotransferase class IV n=1 Tax=Clostridium sp. LIBA-8841 TaxID=2987530 RepID=UPI002AC681AD|nr:aminotransferase class IV [Clostridium sp. LIBA-8841]MDZ5253369.1 aminotransferase class IV [Clostridium sp. LIBA-8841]